MASDCPIDNPALFVFIGANLKVIKNENAERLIKIMIPEKILNLKPIIAGGFVVALYNYIIRYSSPRFDLDLSRKIKVIESEPSHNYIGLKKITKIIDKFGDIDLWFHNTNEIWDPNFKEHFLIGNYKTDLELIVAKRLAEITKELKDIGSSTSNLFAKNSFKSENSKNDRTFYQESKDLSLRNHIKDYGLAETIKNSTYWANSFIIDGLGTNIQFVKKSFASTKDLFESFDIINCCAAYYDGTFFFHDDFEKLYDDGILKTSLDFEKMSILKKIWIATRVFKYRDRYNIEPDLNFCDNIFKTYMDAADLKAEIANGKSETAMIEIERYGDNPYGITEVPIDKVNRMVESLLSSFEEFTGFKNYQDTYNVYLIAINDPKVKKVLDKIMHSDEKSNKAPPVVELPNLVF